VTVCLNQSSPEDKSACYLFRRVEKALLRLNHADLSKKPAGCPTGF
jgi:hypothetical protein